MKLYKAYVNSSFVQGSVYGVVLNLFERDFNERGPKKVVRLLYSMFGSGTLKCVLEVPCTSGGGLKGKLLQAEFMSIATIYFKNLSDIRTLLSTTSDEEAQIRFKILLNGGSYLVSELIDTFGSYTTVNNTVVYNMPNVLLKLM